jgi:hypothetical protein
MAEINPSVFNNCFLYIADNITHNISTSTTYISDTDTNNDYKHLTAKGPFPKIIFNNITTKETEKVISSLPSKSSSGYDQISMKALQISAPYSSSPFGYIFNNAVLAGKFPLRMKYSIVTPIYKKGDKENCGNYRPISLFTSFSKVFEKMISRRILTHVHTSDIPANEQIGFRPKISTETLHIV